MLTADLSTPSWFSSEIERAMAAGRDAATIFRCKCEVNLVAAADLSIRLINAHCPVGQEQYAVDQFNLAADGLALAVNGSYGENIEAGLRIAIYVSPSPRVSTLMSSNG